MKKVWSRNVSFVLAIALLLSVIPAFSIGVGAAAATAFVSTVPVDGYDIGHANDLFSKEATDLFVEGTLENLPSTMNDAYEKYRSPVHVVGDYSVSDGVTAKSGTKCAKIAPGKSVMFHLPHKDRGLKLNTYYLFSFYAYGKDVSQKSAWGLKLRERWKNWDYITEDIIDGYDKANMQNNQWTKISFVLYTGSSYDNPLFYVEIGGSLITSADQALYMDDFSLIELPADVQAAATAFDDYAGNYSSYGEAEQALKAAAGSFFTAGGAFANLSSPIKGVTYGELYQKLSQVDPNSIYGKQAKFAHLSGSLEGYDADHPGNLFNNTDPNTSDTWVDAKLDLVTKITNNYNGYAKSPASGATQLSDGNWVVKLTGETVFHLPRANDTHKTKKNTYYIFSFDMYAETKAAYHEM